jgi:hypothetical protein
MQGQWLERLFVYAASAGVQMGGQTVGISAGRLGVFCEAKRNDPRPVATVSTSILHANHDQLPFVLGRHRSIGVIH